MSYTMEYWEKERIAQSIMILVIFITVVLTILVYDTVQRQGTTMRFLKSCSDSKRPPNQIERK